MHKLISLLVGLLFIAMNAVAAVNVNTANKTELTSLPGIGPSKAQAIIDYRSKNGPFKSIDDLTKVSGIGPVILGRIKNDVALDGPTTVKPAANSAAAKPATPAAAKPEAAKPAAKPDAAKPTPATAAAAATGTAGAAAAKPAAADPAAAAGASAAPKADAAKPAPMTKEEKKAAQKAEKEQKAAAKKAEKEHKEAARGEAVKKDGEQK